MQIADHLAKFERLDAARASLDRFEDSEMWFWTTIVAAMQAMNAALHAVGCSEARDDFPMQVPGIYIAPQPGGGYLRQALLPGDLHLGQRPFYGDSEFFLEHGPLNPSGRMALGEPALLKPLPDVLQRAMRAVEVMEELRDPSIRGTRPMTPELLEASDAAYADFVAIVRQVTGGRA